MAWTVDFRPDADKADVGLLSATYTDQDGTAFSISRRCRVGGADEAEFVAEAKQRLATQVVSVTEAAARAEAVAVKLNKREVI